MNVNISRNRGTEEQRNITQVHRYTVTEVQRYRNRNSRNRGTL